MSRLRWLVVGILAAIGGSFAIAAPPALAGQKGQQGVLLTAPAPHGGQLLAPATSGSFELCDQGGYCLNDWFNGTAVRAYKPGVTNDDYELQGVDRCNHGDYSTPNCPISGIPSGYFIAQIRDPRKSNACFGSPNGIDGQPFGTEMACNRTGYPGTGGGPGTIIVAPSSDSNCHSGYAPLIDSLWTNYDGGWGNDAEVQAYDHPGDTLIMNWYAPTGGDWCYGYFSF
jgi:hypothetical protein